VASEVVEAEVPEEPLEPDVPPPDVAVVTEVEVESVAPEVPDDPDAEGSVDTVDEVSAAAVVVEPLSLEPSLLEQPPKLSTNAATAAPAPTQRIPAAICQPLRIDRRPHPTTRNGPRPG
jgi:hypothetical protein